ncbi:MAG: F0F1-ATPase subunit [Desulfocapsa sp.]|nr:MAG: F0F1-ATPase subunit [Desulfocapsa sp.]
MAKLSTEMIGALGNYGHIGFTFVIAIFLGLGGGIYLDEHYFEGSTSPWFTFIGLAFGIVAGFKSLFDILKSQMEKPEEDETEDTEG